MAKTKSITKTTTKTKTAKKSATQKTLAVRAESKKKAERKPSEENETHTGGLSGRSLWSGSLSFGLLNIPVAVHSAKEEADIGFQMLDKRNFGHIGYRQYNKTTGKEVTRDQIVKGYEYEKGKFVLVTDEDFKKANPRAVSTVDIEDFVHLEEVDPMLFENPYYLTPAQNGEKGYRLLRDVMQKTKKVAIGRVVLFRKHRLVAIIPRGDYLVLEVLRFGREVLTSDEMEGLGSKLDHVKVSSREIEMAEHLVEGMTAKFNANKYHDTYQEQLLAFIQAKAKKGTVEATEPEEKEGEETPKSNIVDLMPLLKKSIEAGRKARGDKARA